MTASQFKQSYGGLSFGELTELVRTSAEFRGDLRTMYEGIFHDTLNHRCINCWWDAYHVIVTTSTERLEKMNNRLFDLRAGCVLIDVVGHDGAKTCTHHNITDELALYHLRTHPEYISEFAKYPDNWQELAIASSPVVQEATRKAEADALEDEAKRIARSERAKKAAAARKNKKTA